MAKQYAIRSHPQKFERHGYLCFDLHIDQVPLEKVSTD
ncbi:hypothetical protein LRHMDP2_1885 [Lacticaseibacillus rhamnosus LRHMDP2]|uniref:Uncharacterized protein n=1 Tax=Lacticaseibacillus rhamnosus LRHMDP3 TaxID=1203259 RepID=A0AB33XWV4_LACRH|nr:hypothetical protein LRHMDP2_1885 [Lacticaseibacillus rhamnosus LRHMDP2]EKS52290.1 hypothetical protein LRHMDP3_661 [Lacticaseibacillus rhamnosus LRHMDP3]